VAVDAMVKSVWRVTHVLEISIERLNISILDNINLIDSLIYSNIICVSAFQMCKVTKSQGNQNEKQKTPSKQNGVVVSSADPWPSHLA
jgi:hypothetical protein